MSLPSKPDPLLDISCTYEGSLDLCTKFATVRILPIVAKARHLPELENIQKFGELQSMYQ